MYNLNQYKFNSFFFNFFPFEEQIKKAENSHTDFQSQKASAHL